MPVATPPPAAIETPAPSIPNYRQQLKKALPAHYFEGNLAALWWFPFHIAVIAAGWWVLANHFSFWTAPFVTIIIGHSFGCMGFLAHDVAHGGMVQNMVLRDLIAGFGFSPLWISPRLWRRWHNADHHTHTQVEGVDPDHLFTMEEYERNPILQFLYRLSPLARNLVIFSSFTYRMTQQQLRMVVVYLRSDKPGAWEKIVIVSQLLAGLVGWVALSSFFGTQVLIWGYLMPLLVTNAMVIAYIATNHFLNPLGDERDVLATSLSVTLPRSLRWLDPFHHYFGAHVAHHLFPRANPKYCRAIEDKAAEMFPDRYHCMPLFTALKTLWDTPWVYEGQTTLIDPVRQERVGTLGHGLDPNKRK